MPNLLKILLLCFNNCFLLMHPVHIVVWGKASPLKNDVRDKHVCGIAEISETTLIPVHVPTRCFGERE